MRAENRGWKLSRVVRPSFLFLLIYFVFLSSLERGKRYIAIYPKLNFLEIGIGFEVRGKLILYISGFSSAV